MEKARTRTVFSLAILLACCTCAFALDPSLDVSQYAHTSWKIREGYFKGRINGIAQTSDGYLWVGTELGLFRFDGVRSAPWQPPADEHLPSNFITTVLVARSGALWIGTDKGLASWRDGKLTSYSEFAGQWIMTLLEDHRGTIWAGTFATPAARLCQITKGETRCYGEDGSLGVGVGSLCEDSAGNLWSGGLTGLWQWKKPGAPTRLPLPIDEHSYQALIGGDDGTLLFINERKQLQSAWPYRLGILNLASGKAQPYPLPAMGRKFEPLHLLRDREGGLWIGTANQGLLHVH